MRARAPEVISRRRTLVGVLTALVVTCAMPGFADAGSRHVLRVEVLSGRADLLSGGQALVAITGISRSQHVRLAIRLNGRNVAPEFGWRPNGQYAGLVTGLSLGRNILNVRRPDGSGAEITLIDYPISGPVFSGPQLEPWTCQPGALDAKCDRPITYKFYYRSNDPAACAAGSVAYVTQGGPLDYGRLTGSPGQAPCFLPYNPAKPPQSVPNTTTDQGKTVPYIVRVEYGNQDRDQYQIAVLYQPSHPWAPWAPQPGWNGKLTITHGSGCGGRYGEVTDGGMPPNLAGEAIPSVMQDEALSRGLAVMTTALDNSNHNCNVAVQAESLMMAKEHFIDTYGPIRYTIGVGSSGGALAQYQIANAYPGIYQGITPMLTFTDAWSAAMDVDDCPLLEQYLEGPSRWGAGISWSPAQQIAVTGATSATVCKVAAHVENIWTNLEPQLDNASQTEGGAIDFQDCGISPQQAFNQSTNPRGVRCTLQDKQANILGRRADGYAARPWDNVGVQYGLQQLVSGAINPAQFVDLNTKIGSHDINYNWHPTRIAADHQALIGVYRAGEVNEANNLNGVAIIDEPGGNTDVHEEYRSFALRARLDHDFGNHDNQVIWDSTSQAIPDSFLAVDRWLSHVERDKRHISLANKIVQDKPADIKDICGAAGSATCQRMYGIGSRGPAGMPLSTDILKCQLKPLRRADYAPVTFTSDEWAALKKVFPAGVCDYTKSGIGQRPTIPWLTYQDAAGHVIYGGRPMGPPPQSVALLPTRRRR
jgi:hypothetical protein